jgi:putative transposase
VQDDEHFHVVCRYVERNALRAELVRRAEQWRWGSLYRWVSKPEPEPKFLSVWPIARLPRWVARVNDPLTEQELHAVRQSVRRGNPLGDAEWTHATASLTGLSSTFRPRGRPRVSGTENNES